jgi:hypothetical protein
MYENSTNVTIKAKQKQTKTWKIVLQETFLKKWEL